MERRDRTDVYYDILKVALKPCKKTRLVYGANLNFEIIQGYILQLMGNDLLMQNENTFETTEKGKNYIRQKEALSKLCQSIVPVKNVIID